MNFKEKVKLYLNEQKKLSEKELKEHRGKISDIVNHKIIDKEEIRRIVKNFGCYVNNMAVGIVKKNKDEEIKKFENDRYEF